MTDVQLLFLVLGVIYLWECAFWAGRTSVNIRTWLGKRWRVAPPSVWLGNQRGSIVFAHPFPPLGTLLSSNPWPLSVSPEAVLAYVPPNLHLARRPLQTSAFFRFDDIQSIEARGKKVWVNGQLLLKTASPTFASYIADTLQSIRRAKAPERARLLEKLVERGFDTKVVEKLSEQFQQSSARLRLTANFLFVYLFAIAPFVIWLFGLSGTWPWLLGGTLVCTIVITVLFHRAHKRLFASAEDERFTHSIIVLLSPASAVRVLDLLARPLLEAAHPLATVRVFCSHDAFVGLARDFLRELRFPALPLCPRPDHLAQETEQAARALSIRTLETFLRRNQLDPEALLQPPVAADPSSRSFCPRCHAQFTMPTGTCPDCGGLPLVAFATAAS